MFFKLIILFTIIPMIELALLIEIGSYIGVWYTLIIVATTGVFGVSLAKSQGFIVINKARQDLGNGIIPGEQLINGVMILIGGAFLLTPGIITDVSGFLLILPGSRDVLRRFIISRLRIMIDNGTISLFTDKR